MDLRKQRRHLGQVVQRQGTVNEIERLIGQRKTVQIPLPIADGLIPGQLGGTGQHLRGEIDTDHIGSPEISGCPAEPAITAAQIQHPLAGKIRQHGVQRRPLRRPRQPVKGAWQLGIALEKPWFVIDIL